MRKTLTLIFTLITLSLFSQIYNPVSWEFSQSKISDSEIELEFKANIEEGWHLYSQDIPESPPATSFTFIINGDTSIKVLEESESIKKYDPNFDMILKYFSNEAIFKHNIKFEEADNFKIEGYVDFMVCDDAQCLPPDYVEFSFNIPEHSTDSKEAEESRWWLFLSALGAGLLAILMPCTFPMIPMTVSFFTKQSKTRSQGIRNAIFYGVSIIVIYIIVGVGVASVFGSDAANLMANNVYFNIGFAILLLIFGASFLGAFEITLPNSWVNKSDKAADRGGYIGIFFMALTLVLVSFSCTGPLVGIVLVKAASGEILDPVIGMFGFSLSLSIPFVLFALFPNWLNSLPKSGGWLNSIKVVLGFLEIAFAFYYLSKADLIDGTAFLTREMFIAIWIMIFASLTLYLLGMIKFSHDSEVKHLSVTRFSLALVTGVYTIYMIPGLWGGPASLMFGMPPDVMFSESPNGVGNSYYQDNEDELLSEIKDLKLIMSQGNFSENNLSLEEITKRKEELKEKREMGPQRIKVFHDYDDAIEYARLVEKPLVIDFTGYACVNCRQMESNVWSDIEIKSILKDDVILVSLHVDATKKLPKEERYETTMAGRVKKIVTEGDKWMVFQANTYGTNSQPYYVFLDNEENTLIENANYQDYGTVSLFKDWLKRGLDSYNK
ncbi:MAG: thiol:disulfide interchange protein [Flavobacteriales bacterium]|nr:thiol:disulfide interchange protein [Flavobacteriales bacterium]